MKRSEVIAAIAFDGIPVDQQVTGEMEPQPGMSVMPGSPGNIKMVMASMLKSTLEESLPADVGESDELAPEHFDALRRKLSDFADEQVSMNGFIPALADETRADFDAKLAVLDRLSRGETE